MCMIGSGRGFGSRVFGVADLGGGSYFSVPWDLAFWRILVVDRVLLARGLERCLGEG